MARGIKNKTNRGDILSFKGEKRLTHWNGKYCNQINGSDSTVFTRMIKPQKRLYSFAQDFCRFVMIPQYAIMQRNILFDSI